MTLVVSYDSLTHVACAFVYWYAEQLVLEKLGLSHLSHEGELPAPPTDHNSVPPAPPTDHTSVPPAPPTDHISVPPPPSQQSSVCSSPLHPVPSSPLHPVPSSPLHPIPTSPLSTPAEECSQSQSRPNVELIKLLQPSSHTTTSPSSLSSALSQLRNKRPNMGSEHVQPKKVALSPSNRL